MFDAAANEVSFSASILGFDRREVRAFIANLVEDYEKLRTELEQLRAHEPAARPEAAVRPEAAAAMGTTAREVQRILEGAQRVVDDLERRAAEESARVVADAHAKAADILSTAQHRADEFTAGARRDVKALEARAAALQAHFQDVRTAFESAADAAGAALSDLATTKAASQLTASGAANVAV
jgi:cell division septum initiation protein DivIVA